MHFTEQQVVVCSVQYILLLDVGIVYTFHGPGINVEVLLEVVLKSKYKRILPSIILQRINNVR